MECKKKSITSATQDTSPPGPADDKGPQGGPDEGSGPPDSHTTMSNTTEPKHDAEDEKKGSKRSPDDPSRKSGTGEEEHDSAQEQKRSKIDTTELGAVDQRSLSRSRSKNGRSKIPRTPEGLEPSKKLKTVPEDLPIFTKARPPTLMDVTISERFRQRRTMDYMIQESFTKADNGELGTDCQDYYKILKETCPPSPFGVCWREGRRLCSMVLASKIATHLQQTPIMDLPVSLEVAAYMLDKATYLNSIIRAQI